MTIKFLVDQNGPKIGEREAGKEYDDLSPGIEKLMIERGIAEPVTSSTKIKKNKNEVKNDDND